MCDHLQQNQQTLGFKPHDASAFAIRELRIRPQLETPASMGWQLYSSWGEVKPVIFTEPGLT